MKLINIIAISILALLANVEAGRVALGSKNGWKKFKRNQYNLKKIAGRLREDILQDKVIAMNMLMNQRVQEKNDRQHTNHARTDAKELAVAANQAANQAKVEAHNQAVAEKAARHAVANADKQAEAQAKLAAFKASALMKHNVNRVKLGKNECASWDDMKAQTCD